MNARQSKILELVRDAKDSIEVGLILEPQRQIASVLTESEAEEVSGKDSIDKYNFAMENLQTAIDMMGLEFNVLPAMTTLKKLEVYFMASGIPVIVIEDENSFKIFFRGRKHPAITFNDKLFAKEYADVRVSDNGKIDPDYLKPVTDAPF